ncbi:hypothetical protein C8F04DRAFT_1196682 [Mycena alexandri]|uniref:F-box domain-containing protein n=1 Tax=Mycena alexandri TaxID=1745969 RepID=A0AAD6WPG6_9AGAR|nr:hypothetical protein C8F04DRAFT_1196682 [Mycena alexandri]
MSTPILPNSVAALRLPTEILAAIFLDVVDPNEADWLEVINARRRIIYVCTRWRAVASSTPALWSKIYVAPTFLPSFIGECLSKTSSAAIVLKVSPHVIRTIEDSGVRRTLKFLPFQDFLDRTVELLRPHFPRVRSLEVGDGYKSHIFEVMERLATFSVGCLSSLRLSASDTYSMGSPPLPLGIQPTGLSVRRVEPLWNTPELYGAVTTLSLARLSWLRWPDLQLVLQSCSSLQELRLSNVQCSTPLDAGRAILRNVAAFKLRYETKADRRFVGFIEMPSLQLFELVACGSGTLDGVARDMPNVLRTAANVLVETDQYNVDELTDLVALCTSAHTINLRECRPLPYKALLGLRLIPGFSLPLLRVLKISDSLTSDDAAALLAVPFGGDLVVNEWVLGDWICVQWRLVDGQISSAVVEGDSGKAGFLVR